ncbi:uncharacterized protein LOC118650666 [Myotis myotis]|uniref:uncharacterized protein LOC118650666 n=1 Tax=Myotis myotis TaxID=51298 RepID=UPI00174DAA8F|nr:uncharacterized protein LOC118650666 [Myotis myotis]
MFQLNFLDEWAIREALFRWPELRWRETQGLPLGTWVQEAETRLAACTRAGPRARLLRIRPKVQKLTAEVEGRHARTRAALSPLPPSSQRAGEPSDGTETQSAEEGACKRPTACELLKRCRLLGRRCAPRGVLLPARRGLQRAHPLRDASSRPSTLCQPRGRRCPRRDRGKFTNTNPGPASPEALSPPPRPLRCTATSTSGLGILAGRGQLAKGCCRGRREWGVAGA